MCLLMKKWRISDIIILKWIKNLIFNNLHNFGYLSKPNGKENERLNETKHIK